MDGKKYMIKVPENIISICCFKIVGCESIAMRERGNSSINILVSPLNLEIVKYENLSYIFCSNAKISCKCFQIVKLI